MLKDLYLLKHAEADFGPRESLYQIHQFVASQKGLAHLQCLHFLRFLKVKSSEEVRDYHHCY